LLSGNQPNGTAPRAALYFCDAADADQPLALARKKDGEASAKIDGGLALFAVAQLAA